MAKKKMKDRPIQLTPEEFLKMGLKGKPQKVIRNGMVDLLASKDGVEYVTQITVGPGARYKVGFKFME